jgi:hypothetical protein
VVSEIDLPVPIDSDSFPSQPLELFLSGRGALGEAAVAAGIQDPVPGESGPRFRAQHVTDHPGAADEPGFSGDLSIARDSTPRDHIDGGQDPLAGAVAVGLGLFHDTLAFDSHRRRTSGVAKGEGEIYPIQ